MSTKKIITPELYPLFACIGAGVAASGYIMYHNSVNHPDVSINKSAPMPFLNTNEKNYQHFYRWDPEEYKKKFYKTYEDA